MTVMAAGTRSLVSVLKKARGGRYTVYVGTNESDGTHRQATEQVELSHSGMNVVVRGSLGDSARALGQCLHTLDGGYLVLTETQPLLKGGWRTTWAWQVLAGTLIPLGGDEAWHVTQHHPKAQGSRWLSEKTRYENAWSPS